MNEILITLLVCVVIYEIVEHIILPLFWILRNRGRKLAYGLPGMIGKRCVVKQWAGTHGKVWVNGELFYSRLEEGENQAKGEAMEVPVG